MITLKVHVTLIEEMLGMAPADPEIYKTYIGTLAPDAQSAEEEVASLGVDKALENKMTVFPRTVNGEPLLWDYQVRGYFKDAVSMLRRVPGSECSKVKTYKKMVDGLLFAFPRQIPIHLPEGAGMELANCQRPLRTSGPSGERTALAISETVPEGSTLDFSLTMLDDAMEKWVMECLDYGYVRGLGQWRNSGKGKFTYEITNRIKSKIGKGNAAAGADEE